MNWKISSAIAAKIAAMTNNKKQSTPESSDRRRIPFMLHQFYSDWMRRGTFRNWITKGPFYSGKSTIQLFERPLNGSYARQNQCHGRQDSTLCKLCQICLTSGRFQAIVDGIEEDLQLLQLGYEVTKAQIEVSSQIGCTLCGVIETTLADAAIFAREAVNRGLSRDEALGMKNFSCQATDSLVIWLNLSGTRSQILAFQVEIQMTNTVRVLTPCFRWWSSISNSSSYDTDKSHEIITDVGSPDAFRHANAWMKACETYHLDCDRPKPEQLPTRLLDVGIGGDSSNAIRLVESSGQSGFYLALSYCWGPNQTTILTEENRLRFVDKIILDTLPQTILDAVLVTRELDFRYLWVDSLCIIQDSKTDKTREISRMGLIFKNAHLTISAASSSSVQEGFIYPRPPFHVEPIQLPFRNSQGGEIETAFLYAVDELPGNEKDEDPIERRAWTLQERILSRRLLIYSSTHLQWACRSIPLGPGHFEHLQGKFVNIAKNSESGQSYVSHGVRQRNSLYAAWEEAVMVFTRRSLTYSKDTLRAIAGIAEQYEMALSDTYIAGLWKNELLRGLTWRAPLSFKLEDFPQTKVHYISPSWSWASSSLQVSFGSSLEILTNIEIQHCSVTLVDETARFGDVKDGLLLLKAPARKAWKLNEGLFCNQASRFESRIESEELVAHVCADRREEVKEPPGWVTCVKLTYNSGLVLRPVSKSRHVREDDHLMKYRRVGYFSSHDKLEWEVGWDFCSMAIV